MAKFKGDLSSGRTIQMQGFTVTASVERDEDMGAPWEEHDGHGEVSEWTARDKRAGEVSLDGDGHHRYYNWKAAIATAKKDGWDSEPFGTGTKGQRAERAVKADFERLKAWCDDQWWWVGVVLTVSKEGIELCSKSLWGIESDAGDYLSEVANELLDEALEDAKAVIGRLVK